MEINANLSFNSIFSTLSNYYFMYLVFMQLMKALQPIMSKGKKKREKKGLIFF